MGLDVYGRTFIGTAVSREDVFTLGGSKRVCAVCLTDYTVCPAIRSLVDDYSAATPLFCPKDGGKISDVSIEVPTTAFATKAVRSGFKDPEVYWQHLTTVGGTSLAINRVSTFDHSDNAHPVFALGYLLGETGSHRNPRAPDAVAYDVERTGVMTHYVRMAADDMGLPVRPINIYTSVYLSY